MASVARSDVAAKTARLYRLALVMRASAFLLLVPLSTALASCSSCAKKSDGTETTAPVVLSPVPAPPGLLAEMTIANPDAFWGRLQHGTGGLVALLPMSLGGLVTTFGSIDGSLATAIDGASPAYAGAVARGADDVGWAVSVKLTDIPHARAILIDGESAHYDGHEDGIWTILTRKGGALGGSAAPPQIAISSTGALVIADDADDLKSLGAYLVRTMPSKPRGSADVDIDVPRSAFAGPLSDRVAALWAQTKSEKAAQATEAKDKHGREADFGDPNAILALADGAAQKRLAILTDLQNTHIAIGADAATLTIDATLTPNEGNGKATTWINELASGDAAPLLAAPLGTGVMMARSGQSDAKVAAADFESMLKAVLGARLDDSDAKLAHAAASDWSAGAGDVLTATLSTEGPPGVLVVTSATAPPLVTRSALEACQLLDRPAFRQPLGSVLGITATQLGSTEIAALGHASTFRLQRGPVEFLSAAWLARDGNMSLAVSADAPKFLAASASSPHSWHDDPVTLARATALGPQISLAIAARPFPTSDPLASLFFAWGRDGKNGHVSLEASDVVVREAIRFFAH